MLSEMLSRPQAWTIQQKLIPIRNGNIQPEVKIYNANIRFYEADAYMQELLAILYTSYNSQ